MKRTPLVRLPPRFIQDHRDRGLPTPKIVRSTRKNVWVRVNDPHLAALVDDAKHYADPAAQDHDYGARALLRAVGKAGL